MGHSDTARALHFTLCSGRVKISGRYTVTTETCGGPRLVRSGYIYILFYIIGWHFWVIPRRPEWGWNDFWVVILEYGSDVDFLGVQSDSIETDRVCDIPRFLVFTRSRIRVDPTVSSDLIVAYHPWVVRDLLSMNNALAVAYISMYGRANLMVSSLLAYVR